MNSLLFGNHFRVHGQPFSDAIVFTCDPVLTYIETRREMEISTDQLVEAWKQAFADLVVVPTVELGEGVKLIFTDGEDVERFL